MFTAFRVKFTRMRGLRAHIYIENILNRMRALNNAIGFGTYGNSVHLLHVGILHLRVDAHFVCIYLAYLLSVI